MVYFSRFCICFAKFSKLQIVVGTSVQIALHFRFMKFTQPPQTNLLHCRFMKFTQLPQTNFIALSFHEIHSATSHKFHRYIVS